MNHAIIYTFALFVLAFGCSDRAHQQAFKQERDTLTSLNEIFETQDTGALVQALRVIPGQSWSLWSPQSDSAWNGLSQNFSAGQERLLTFDSLRYQFINDSTVRAFALDNDTVYQTLTYSNDTLRISDGNSVVISSGGGGDVDSIGLSQYNDSLYVNALQTAHIRIPIADRGWMEYWNAAINDTSSNRVTNVIIYGDSNTEFFPEAFTIPIRDILTKNLGGAGYGWMNMRSDRQDHVDILDLGTWYSPASNAYGDLSLDRFDRTWYADSLDGIEYEFTPSSLENGASAAKESAKCKRVELHYYGYGSSQVRAEITNESNPTTYDTLTTSPGYNVWAINLPEYGYHDATFQIIGGDSIRAMGINFTTPDSVGRSGVIVHRIGHSGATADEFHGIADTLFQQQIQNLEADLIVFQLGGNSYGNTAGSKTELDSLLNKVRVWNDSISLAILVPNANGSVNEVELGKTHDRNYWYLSRKHKTGFGSLFQLHGEKWIADSAGLFYSNGAHFTPIGGRINADFICKYVLGIFGDGTNIVAGEGVSITGDGTKFSPYNISSSVLDINVYEDDDTLTGNRIIYARSGHYFAIAYDGDVNESILVDLNTNIISQLRVSNQNSVAHVYATALSNRTLPTGGQTVPGPGAGFISTNGGRRFVLGQLGGGSQGGIEFHAGTNTTYPGFHFVFSESDTIMSIGTHSTEIGEVRIGYDTDQGDHNLQVQGSALIDSVEVQGMRILAGSAAPSASMGTQGSLYMRDDNDSTLYTKTATGWILIN